MTKPVFRMALAVLMFVLAACGGAPAVPPAAALVTQVPTTAAPAAPAVPTAPVFPTTTISTTMPAATAVPEARSTGPLHDVPRNRTLVLGWGTQSPIGVTNPWAVPGYTHQEGNNLLWEGLSYYAIFADKEIPFPLYPGLQRFLGSPAVTALEAAYQPRRFDRDASATLMTDAGFTKNADGLWQKNGQTVNATINGFAAFQSDIAPILVEMLKAAGFDASAYFGADAYQHMRDGQPGLYLYGHGASLTDPYATLDMYHSRYSRPTSQPAVDGYWSRYKNPAYDKLLDDMAPRSSDDPLFQADAAKALEIYWKDQIDIPVIQWLHRIPYNQTYWTNWPTKENPAGGTNDAFWAHTGMLVITQLKAIQ